MLTDKRINVCQALRIANVTRDAHSQCGSREQDLAGSFHRGYGREEEGQGSQDGHSAQTLGAGHQSSWGHRALGLPGDHGSLGC